MFSIIIPLYNKEKYISKAIQSVLDQSYSEFELIIVDNNSSDSGLQKAKEFKDERISFYTEFNKGVSFARNRGISEAKHPYICFLDADDYWLKDHLINFKNLISEYPDSGLYSNSYRIVESNGEIRNRVLNETIESDTFLLKNYFKEVSSGDSPVNVDVVCIPKNILLEFGGFPTHIDYGEDSLLWSRIFLKYPFALSNYVGAVYVRTADNRSDIPEKLCIELPVVKEFEKLLEKKEADIYEKDIRAFISKQLFLNLVSCIKVSKMKQARMFARDPRINNFPHQGKLSFVKFLSITPAFFAHLFFFILVKLGLVK
jgi:glycosyltransferase involved in cell wall biosynthesis